MTASERVVPALVRKSGPRPAGGRAAPRPSGCRRRSLAALALGLCTACARRFRRSAGSLSWFLVSWSLGVLAPWSLARAAVHQTASQPAEDVERMVREGMVEALKARFRGGQSLDELRLIARAQTSRAARTADEQRRQREFQEAEKAFLIWIAAAERDRELERRQRAVNAAAARVEYAGMILSQWISPDLDQFELTGGKRVAGARLLELLLKARQALDEAAEALRPLADEIARGDPELEDRYLALGLFDAIPRLQTELRYSRAWASLYVARVDQADRAGRATSLRSAESDFRALLEREPGGEMRARCLLGLGLALREQGRLDEARRQFEAALGAAGEGPLAAQVRYERAQCELRDGKFEEARAVLRPLVEKNPDALRPQDQPARFYVNLAHLWDALSYLLESQALRHSAEGSPARQAVLLRAGRTREIGLRKMNELAGRGGGWPALVQLFVADVIDMEADARTLTPAELLFAARWYADQKKHRHALSLLKAAARADVEAGLAGEILFELGVCHYRCREEREAAAAFERLAREHKDHPKAKQALTYAYQLWAGIAEASTRREDYSHLADVLLNLLQSFPEHEEREAAAWWLPVALQAAGRYREAAEQFGNVPAGAPRWEEAQYRAALCERLRFDAERSTLGADELRLRAAQVTDRLKSYARQVSQRADRAADPAAVRDWAAAALVSAAEVHASDGVADYQRALDLLADFEQRYQDSGQMGRVLAVRISAYRGLGQYEQAAQVVQQFLHRVAPDQAGGTLAAVARGMQEEVERLDRSGDREGARKLAEQALPTFEQLYGWVRADAGRARYVDAVRYGLAQMAYFAGRCERAQALIGELLEADPRNGNYQRLYALVLTAPLLEDATPEPVAAAATAETPALVAAAERLAAAREAWGVLLRDPSLRSSAPQRYWEARYYYLELLLREGRAREVEQAIRQERVWYPDLDLGTWGEKLDGLYQRAAAQAGPAPGTSQPAAPPPTDTAPADTRATDLAPEHAPPGS